MHNFDKSLNFQKIKNWRNLKSSLIHTRKQKYLRYLHDSCRKIYRWNLLKQSIKSLCCKGICSWLKETLMEDTIFGAPTRVVFRFALTRWLLDVAVSTNCYLLHGLLPAEEEHHSSLVVGRERGTKRRRRRACLQLLLHSINFPTTFRMNG